MTSEREAHPDEGTIHAWLDRQLDATSSATLEAHLQRCDECAERVAEARGLIAGASRVIGSLDDPEMSAAGQPEPMRPLMLARSGTPRRQSSRLIPRLTPARSAIAAVLVVAVGLAIVHEHERPTSRLASTAAEGTAATGAASQAAPAGPTIGAPVVAAPMVGGPMAVEPKTAAPMAAAPAAAPPATVGMDSTAAMRVAAARTFARAQRETTVNADLARVGQAPAARASAPVEQTIAAAKAADNVAREPGSAAGAQPSPAMRGVAGGTSRGAATLAPQVAALEAPQCYRVESATGVAASWGPVPLPFVLALDAPVTRASARVLTADGQDTDTRAVFERRDGDSLTFTLRRLGYTGTLTVGSTGEVRAGVMRSAPTTLALSEVVTTAAPTEQRRAALRKPSAAAARADSAATPAPQRDAAPAVPVVVRKAECGR